MQHPVAQRGGPPIIVVPLLRTRRPPVRPATAAALRSVGRCLQAPPTGVHPAERTDRPARHAIDGVPADGDWHADRRLRNAPGRWCSATGRDVGLAAAALHGGAEPDLLEEVAWWQTDDFWQYALYAAVAYIRAAASRAGVPVRQACQDLGQRPSHPGP
jgi:hypothetical protein